MQELFWQIFLKRKRSLMGGKTGSDMLCQFQSTDVTGIEFTEAVSLHTRNELGQMITLHFNRT